MSVVVHFSAELRRWMLHNLERGCAPAQLVDSMIDRSFEPHVARGLVEAFVLARAAGSPPPGDRVELELPEPAYSYGTPRLPSGTSIRTPDRAIPILARVEQPVVAVLEGVLSAAECDAMVELGRPRLRPSTVVDPDTGADAVAEYRDSEGAFFRLGETPLVARIEARLAAIMAAPLEHGEGLQVLRYGPGARTAPHFDYLVPSNPANAASLARSGQRVATLVVYLNDVAAGGETVFPAAGLSVSPRKGNAVYFEYANAHRQVDPRSLHAGAPVASGEKWALTKWVRERPFVSA